MDAQYRIKLVGLAPHHRLLYRVLRRNFGIGRNDANLIVAGAVLADRPDIELPL